MYTKKDEVEKELETLMETTESGALYDYADGAQDALLWVLGETDTPPSKLIERRRS